MNDTFVALISVIVTAIVGPIAVNLVQKKLEKKDSKDLLREAIDTNSMVVTKLEEVKDDFLVDRVWICQFHNGGYFYPTGKSIQKFSMIYEILGNHVNSQQAQFQNIPIGLFSKSIHKLALGEVISIPHYGIDESYGLESFAESNGTKSGYLFPLMTIDNKFIGIVGLDFITDRVLTPAEVNNIGLEISSIGGVLMNEQIYRNK